MLVVIPILQVWELGSKYISPSSTLGLFHFIILSNCQKGGHGLFLVQANFWFQKKILNFLQALQMGCTCWGILSQWLLTFLIPLCMIIEHICIACLYRSYSSMRHVVFVFRSIFCKYVFPFITNYFQCRGILGKTTIYKRFTHRRIKTVTKIQVQKCVILFLTHRHWYCVSDFAGESCNCRQKISPHLQVGHGRTFWAVSPDWHRFQSSQSS